MNEPAATPLPQIVRNHRWNTDSLRRIDGHDCPDGNDRTERDCVHCGLVKITVHAGDGTAWREWRHRAGGVYVGTATPPCLGEDQT